jgi:hypothetical protein
MENNVAQIIAQQLGGKALFMLGAKDMVACPDALMFRIGRNAKSINKIVVRLDPSDTYTVEFWRGRSNLRMVSSFSDIYVDSLHGLIESETGMYTSL